LRIPWALEVQEDGEGFDAENVLVPTETTSMDEQRDYDVDLYARLLLNSYASRLAVAFTAEDFGQLFRITGQMSLFDRSLDEMQLRWIRCPASASSYALKEHKVEETGHHGRGPATGPNEKVLYDDPS
jgi:hypothetical protein